MDEKWINLWQRNVVKLHWRSFKSFGFVYCGGWFLSPCRCWSVSNHETKLKRSFVNIFPFAFGSSFKTYKQYRNGKFKRNNNTMKLVENELFRLPFHYYFILYVSISFLQVTTKILLEGFTLSNYMDLYGFRFAFFLCVLWFFFCGLRLSW